MRIFITGATGFIGSYLVRLLCKRGYQIMCLKRKSSNLFRLDDECLSCIRWIDVEDDYIAEIQSFDPDIIYNMAWGGVSAKDRDNWIVQAENILFQQRILSVASQCHTSKIIGIGSQAEYGDFKCKMPETYPANPCNAYAASKVSSLTMFRSFCALHDIDWYWFRIFPLFGPYEDGKWLIPSLIRNICTTNSMDLTKGEQLLPYLYVGECAKALASVVDVRHSSGIYNICSDNPVELRQLVTYIKDYIRPDFQLNFGALPYRKGQSMLMLGDTTRLKEHLYHLDTSDFFGQLDKTIKYYQALYQS